MFRYFERIEGLHESRSLIVDILDRHVNERRTRPSRTPAVDCHHRESIGRCQFTIDLCQCGDYATLVDVEQHGHVARNDILNSSVVALVCIGRTNLSNSSQAVPLVTTAATACRSSTLLRDYGAASV